MHTSQLEFQFDMLQYVLYIKGINFRRNFFSNISQESSFGIWALPRILQELIFNFRILNLYKYIAGSKFCCCPKENFFLPVRIYTFLSETKNCFPLYRGKKLVAGIKVLLFSH